MRTVLSCLLAAMLLAGCGDEVVGPEGIDASGAWTVLVNGDALWFFDLREGPGGAIGGSWSWPGVQHGNAVRGTRAGSEVRLVADSHNAFAVLVDLRQLRPDRMTGRMELDDRFWDVVFVRD